MNNTKFRFIVNTFIIFVCALLITTIIHILLGVIFSFENSITGKPNMINFVPIFLVQIVLMVVAYNLIKEYLPFNEIWKKGLIFAVFFILAVQIPSTIGIIAYETNSQWQFFTETKIANYITIFGDIVTFLIIGIFLGKLFPAKEKNTSKAYKIGFASYFGAVVFPLLLFVVMKIFYSVIHVNDVHAPFQDLLWFNLVFYGIFFMTGFCLPILHGIIKQNKPGNRIQKILYTTFIFCLLWLPIQNFMVVFGWGFTGGFVFSLVSIVPIFLTILISDYFIKSH